MIASEIGDGRPSASAASSEMRREEALLHPLQHEAVLRQQSIAGAGALQGERPDPGIELLRRELRAKRVEAALPEKRIG